MHPSASHLVPHGAAVIEAAERMGVPLFQELTAAQVETNTAVCSGMGDLRGEIAFGRGACGRSRWGEAGGRWGGDRR